MQSAEASDSNDSPATPTPAEEVRARYAAFISYRQGPVDSALAAWVLQALESYRTPRSLIDRGVPERVGRLYRDEDEAGADGHVREQILRALQDSAWLVLVMSPRTAGSPWVKLEIAEFARTHPVSRILPLTVEGDPLAAERLVAEVLGEAAAAQLPLGANVLPRPGESPAARLHKAMLRLAAAMLGCGYDDLIQRDAQRAAEAAAQAAAQTAHRQRVRRYAATFAVAYAALGGLAWWDINIHVKTYWYRQMDERWGQPVGRGSLSEDEAGHRRASYRFRLRKGQVLEVARVNGRGRLVADRQFEPFEDPSAANVARWTYANYADGLPAQVTQYDAFDVMLRRIGYQFLPDRTQAIARFERSFGLAQRDMANSGSLDTMFRVDAPARALIGQHRLYFDDHGRLLRRDFEPVGGGAAIPDTLGYFGVLYGYDVAGRPASMSGMAPDGTRLRGFPGQPVIVKASWAGEEVAQVGWFDSEGHAARNAGGVAVVRLERDRWGNTVKEAFLDANRQPALSARWKYVIQRYAYDDHGGLVQATFWSANGEKALTYGFHRIDYQLDAQGRTVQTRNFDLQGRPTPSRRTGCAVTIRQLNEQGFEEDWRCLDAQGRPVPDRDNGVARMHYKRDAQGKATETASFSPEDKPYGGKSGIAVGKREYDGEGRLVRWQGFDAQDRPMADADTSFAEIRHRYDANGNELEYAGYGPDGQLALHANGHWAVISDEFDARGNLVTRRWLDTNRRPTLNADVAAASQHMQYFDNGLLKSWRLLGVNGEPVTGKTCHRWDYERDAADRKLAARCLDGTGQPALDLETGAHVVRYEHGAAGWTRRSLFGLKLEPVAGRDDHVSIITQEYDATGQVALLRYFGPQGEPVAGTEEGVHAVRHIRDPAGNVVERMTYDARMQLTAAQDDGAAWIKSRFDAAGNEIEARYFGPDGRPVKHKGFGTHVMRKTYDTLAQDTAVAFFDEHDRPARCTDDDTHRTRRKYDPYGNMEEEAYFDEHDKPMLATDSGVAVKRWVYTPSGDKLREAYFDVNGQPMLDSVEHVHAKVFDIDARGNPIRMRTLDTAGQLKPDTTSRVAESHRIYGLRDRMLEKTRFDAHGKPAASVEDGVWRWVYAYDDRGHRTVAASFGTDGKPVRAKGEKCEVTLKLYDAQDRVKSQRCGTSRDVPPPASPLTPPPAPPSP